MYNYIQFNEINLKFSHPERHVLNNINLTITKGESTVILGSNGCGKSSLLKLLDKRFQPSTGSITIADKKLCDYAPQNFAKLLVTLTQNPLLSLFPNLTVYENCLMAAKQCDYKMAAKNFGITLREQQSASRQRKKIACVTEGRSYCKQFFEVYLQDFNSNLPCYMKNLVATLSGGEQQALALALACFLQPQILLLDEHTSALDPHTAERLMRTTFTMVQKYNMTCILTTHQLDFALHYGTRIIALKQGQIYRDFCLREKNKLNLEQLKLWCYD